MSKFTYEVSIRLPLDLPQVERLIVASSQHYDAKCRAAGMQGGCIYGWRNSLDFSQGTDDRPYARFREIDTAAKCVEFCDDAKDIFDALYRALGEINSEFRRVSGVVDA